MTQKRILYGAIFAIIAVSAGIVTYSTVENQVQPQFVQIVSAFMLDAPIEVINEMSDYAIVGEVVKLEPFVFYEEESVVQKNENKDPTIIIVDKEILTDVTIKVEEDLFEKYDEKFITVRILGGEIPEMKTVYDISPGFVKGERVIVFVGNGDSYNISEDIYTIVGMEQGTVRLQDTVISKYADDNMSEQDMKTKIKLLRK